ncbi:penicillin-binding protein 2 [Nocardioides sp. R-C-SC26]|uniref:peptidoglycan D,D-transpeptidase FtsI family protein n=1 Tax=Nocardioides sp. R-C-SC26 TaxID=2870414 RepID=UPI001E2B9A5B|nr:penicillin-binding protein 2 [Nocardioides sp. R-C-SC26]
MNKPIRTIAVFCLALFLALMVNVTYLQFWKSDRLDEDPRNQRVLQASYSSERGAILVGRTPIAESTPVDDRYEFQRLYPQPFLYAPATGYFTFGNSTGVEASQNAVLSGDDPRFFVRRLVDMLSNEPAQGGNVQLTLDPAAQKAAFDGLRALGDGVEGAVVAIEPDTGKILAMVSLPSYDPNKLASHDFDAVENDYQRLLEDDRDPLINRALATRLFPGSTFKVVTAAAALSSGKYEGPDALVPGGATFQLPQTSGESGLIDNEGRNCGSGEITLRQAMEQSCNTSFAKLAIDVGAEEMFRQAERFGFNADYLEDIKGQARSVFPADLSEPEVGQAGFGQFDVQATPLQMAMVMAAIANRGVLMRPYLVNQVQSAEYDAETTRPEEISQAVSDDVARTLTEVLVSTVDNGTAAPSAIPGVRVAGKTGTAQRGVEGQPPYGWFISFAPADNAEVAVAVMIEEAPGRSIAGGALGGPIAKAVMEAVLQ